MSEMFPIFVGAGKPALHTDESVFALSLSEMWQFQRIKGRWATLIHSFRLCGKGMLYLQFPHIYLGVEYWMRLF